MASNVPGRAKEGRRFRNQQELDEIRKVFSEMFDVLQKQIDEDRLDNLDLTAMGFDRDITTDDDEWVRRESLPCKIIMLRVTTRDNGAK